MPGTREIITTIKQFQDLAAEKPMSQKRVYATIKLGSLMHGVRLDPAILADIIETMISVKGKDVTPTDVGLEHFAVVDRVTTIQLKPETVIFLQTRT